MSIGYQPERLRAIVVAARAQLGQWRVQLSWRMGWFLKPVQAFMCFARFGYVDERQNDARYNSLNIEIIAFQVAVATAWSEFEWRWRGKPLVDCFDGSNRMVKIALQPIIELVGFALLFVAIGFVLLTALITTGNASFRNENRVCPRNEAVHFRGLSHAISGLEK